MQELRFVLIIVGALAIAALLFHGFWSSKKESKAKFADKPLGKLDPAPASLREHQREKMPADPASEALPIDAPHDTLVEHDAASSSQDEPQFETENDLSLHNSEPMLLDQHDEFGASAAQPTISDDVVSVVHDHADEQEQATEEPEPEMQVIVLNVHCEGDVPFVGDKLFESMQQNGLFYGEMDIFHRHADLSGTGKVLFSVANMMKPGTFQHSDPAEFTTKGISFFMTLPCFGQPDQNFKLMLKTAQQIADDMGGYVLDDQRNLMTPMRLDAYRQQIQAFKAAQA